MTHPIIDQEARDMAQAAKNAVNTHELVCAERWRATMESMKGIKSLLSRAIGTLILTMMGLIGWLAKLAFLPT